MKRFILSWFALAASLPTLYAVPLRAQEPAAADAEAEPQAEQRYLLRYKFATDEVVRWQVVHQGSTETTIGGNTQTSQSRSSSVKLWRVTAVDDEGHMTLVHSVESINMWQKLSDRPEVRYNSRTDKEPPPDYEQAAKTVGVPLTTFTITPDGQIQQRDSQASRANLGLGDIVMLLPPKSVKVGSRWFEPGEIRVRLADGRSKRIKTRKLYTLEKVQTGVATIRVVTQVLTPVDDARIEAQLVQQLVEGTIKFDLDAGRILKKQMDWDESVIGFDGPDSQMKYAARFTEELLPAAESTAELPVSTAPAGSAARTRRSDKPALRRR